MHLCMKAEARRRDVQTLHALTFFVRFLSVSLSLYRVLLFLFSFCPVPWDARIQVFVRSLRVCASAYALNVRMCVPKS